MTLNSVDKPVSFGESSLENLLGQLESKMKLAEQGTRKAKSEKSALEELLEKSRAQTEAAETRVEEVSRQMRELESKNRELSSVFEREYANLKRAFDQHQEKVQHEMAARREELVQHFGRQESALARSLSDSRLETQAALVKLTECRKSFTEAENAAAAEKDVLIAQARKFNQDAIDYWNAYQKQNETFQSAWKKIRQRLHSSEEQLAYSSGLSERLKEDLAATEIRYRQQDAASQEKIKILTHVLGQTRQALTQATHEKNAALEKQSRLQRTIELELETRAKLNRQETRLQQTLQSKESEVTKLKDELLKLRAELMSVTKQLHSYETPTPIQFSNSTCLPGTEPRTTFQQIAVRPEASPSEIEELLVKRVSELAALESEVKRLSPTHPDRKKGERAKELLRTQIVHLRTLLPVKSAAKIDSPMGQ